MITTHADKTENIPYAYANGTNRLIGMGKEKIAYDATGRRTEDARFTYTYNARGRLKTITNKTTKDTTRYQYRLDGLRVSKTTGNETTFYVYDASQRLVAESNSKGDIHKEYLWLGLMPVAVIEDDNIYYIHPDHLGTPRLVTNKYKQVVWQWQSTPFGKGKPNENGLTLNLRFPGQYYDDETGLHYNWWRYYEAETGRYITSDPIGLRGDINSYVYSGNTPNKYIDYNGLRKLTSGEIALVNLVFQDSVDTSIIEINNSQYPLFFGMQDVNTTVTPNGNLYFHTDSRLYREDFSKANETLQAHFIHEIAHVWQHQYGYPVGLEGILEHLGSDNPYSITLTCSTDFIKLGLEQQAQIISNYFLLRYFSSSSAAGNISQSISLYEYVLNGFLSDPVLYGELNAENKNPTPFSDDY